VLPCHKKRAAGSNTEERRKDDMNANADEAIILLRPSKEARLETLMREYGEKILHLAYLMVKDRAIAEDITQEVFMKAYQAFDSFRGESSVKTWLYRIAMNESKKYLRSWSFRQIFSTLGQMRDEYMERVSYPDVESTVISNMNKEDIAEAVMSLSPSYRQIITLYYYEDLSIKEVAQVLGISEAVVRAKLHRARKQFKKRIEKEGSIWI
jgi:RNA polymerase sigma-70 factor (ECF subfamily)